MLVRIAKRLNPDLGLHCLPLHFWQKNLMLGSRKILCLEAQYIYHRSMQSEISDQPGYQPTRIRFMNFLFIVGKHILLILSAFTACEILISIYDVWIVHLLNILTFYLPIL